MKFGVLKLTADECDYDEIMLNGCMYRKVSPKPKRYILPMPDGTAKETSEDVHIAIHEDFGPWHSSECRYDITNSNDIGTFTVTQVEIDAAPNWVKALNPMEVTDDAN